MNSQGEIEISSQNQKFIGSIFNKKKLQKKQQV